MPGGLPGRRDGEGTDSRIHVKNFRFIILRKADMRCCVAIGDIFLHRNRGVEKQFCLPSREWHMMPRFF